MRDCLRGAIGAALLVLGATAGLWAAGPYPVKTIEEIKVEVQARADRNLYPLYGLDRAVVHETLARIHTVDPEEWGREWMRTGDVYFERAKTEKAQPAAARADYLAAYHYYAFGRWPVPTSAQKREAYAKAMLAFAAYAERAEPKIEIVRVPFEGTEVVGYLVKPPGATKAPVLMSISGVDYWKEDLTRTSSSR